jgi:hypothetical protein
MCHLAHHVSSTLHLGNLPLFGDLHCSLFVTRSYVYAIDGRGRVFTDAYGLTTKLAEAGVDTKAVEVNRVFPSGKVVSARQVIKDEARVVYWLPVSAVVPDRRSTT